MPQAVFVNGALHDRELPLWNPLIYCGHPFVANIQVGLFYPPRLIATLLGGVSAPRTLYSLELEVLLHVLLAGIFCFLLLDKLGATHGAALFGATSFQLGCFFTSQIEHLGAIEAAAWLPCIWLLILRSARQITLRNSLLLTGAVAMMILSGFVPMTAVILLASSIFLIILIISRPGTGRALSWFFVCVIASLFLAAVALVPAVQLTLLSVSRYRADWIGNGGGLPLASLFSLVWPNAFHVLDRGLYHAPYEITFMYLYSGLLTMLGTISVLISRHLNNAAPFGVMAIVSCFCMLGASTLVGASFLRLMPAQLRGVAYPQEWIAPFSLSLCIVGACGISRLLNRKYAAALAVLLAACDLTWFGSNRPFNSELAATNSDVTAQAFAGSRELLDKVKTLASRTTPPARIDTINDSIDWVGSATITNVPTTGGEDPMALARYIQARLAVSDGKRWGYYYQINHVVSPILEALNVCCLLSRTLLPPAIVEHSPYSNNIEVPGGYLYNSNSVLARFYLVHAVISASTMAQAARIWKQSNWDPRKAAIVENFGGLPPQSGQDPQPKELVHIRSYHRNSVELETRSSQTSFLVSSEANYPGWTATIDGQATGIYYTNIAFRGVAVPAGNHIIKFQFRPILVFVAVAISALSLLIYSLVFLLSRRFAEGPY